MTGNPLPVLLPVAPRSWCTVLLYDSTAVGMIGTNGEYGTSISSMSSGVGLPAGGDTGRCKDLVKGSGVGHPKRDTTPRLLAHMLLLQARMQHDIATLLR